MHEIVCTMNFVLKNQLKWPEGNDLIEIMDGFKGLCGMPSVHGNTNAMQIHV